MQVTLLGTGDTTGTPTVGCDCDTCAAAKERGVERTRPAIHVANPATGESLLIDVSPDFRHQFLTHDVALPDAALLTHVHFDHVDGLGNVYRVFDHLPVHTPSETDPKTGESIGETIREKYHYLDRISIHEHTQAETFRVCGFDVTFHPVTHPPLLSYAVTVEDPNTGGTLAFTGDTNFDVPDATKAALADADLLLADGLVPASLCKHHPLGGTHKDDEGTPRTFGTKHMTREGALDLAAELSPDRTRLVHVSHFYPPDEAFEDPLAVDGEQYEF